MKIESYSIPFKVQVELIFGRIEPFIEEIESIVILVEKLDTAFVANRRSGQLKRNKQQIKIKGHT